MEPPSKRCCTCSVVRPLSEFNVRTSAADGRQARCRLCNQRWYLENREEHRANVRRRNARVRRELHELLAAYLAGHPCVDCGESDVRCLEFDHRDPTAKVSEVTVLVRLNASARRVQEEIEKCDVRCANCHRRVTAERGRHWRQAVHERAAAESAALSLARLEAVFSAASRARPGLSLPGA